MSAKLLWTLSTAFILAFVVTVGPVLADTVYVEARNGTGLTTGVTQSGFSNSGAACGSVQSLYGTTSTTWVQVQPTLGVAGGSYDVQVCHSGNTFNNISTSLLTDITLTNATALSGDVKDLGYTGKWQESYQDCTYYSVGVVKLNPGVTQPTIRFTYRSGAIGGSDRWNVLGWCFVQVDANQKQLTLVPVPSNAAMSLTGSGPYAPGAQITPTATPNVGFSFVKWSSNPQGTDAVTLPYTMPSSDVTLYAIFEGAQYSLTRSACTGGSVSGSSGDFTAGAPVTITATPDPGYAFIGWTTDGCDGTSFAPGGASYSFDMPEHDCILTAVFGKARLIENFERYSTGGLSIDSLDMNDSVGPNMSVSGGGNPWWGWNPPNGRINPYEAHSGAKSLWGTAGNCKDLYNLAYRLNSGPPIMGSVYLDWWFFDPLGPGGDTVDFCADYSALAYYSGVPTNADYPTPMPSPMPTSMQQLAIGMSDDFAAGYMPSRYQVRIQNDSGGYHSGWFNTSVTRSVGWHHARVLVGPRKANGRNSVQFYIDDMSSSVVGPRDGLAPLGFNVVEVNTIMPVAGSCTSSGGCRYSKYFHFSSVDDFSLGNLPDPPGSGALETVGADRITWNWGGGANADGFKVWNASTGGAVTASAASGAQSAVETGLVANTRYERWLSSYLSEYCGSIDSVRTGLPPAYTLAMAPVYGATGAAAISCSNGRSGAAIPPGSATTFTAVNGFGVGPERASSYLYLWDSAAGEPSSWTGALQWTSGELSFSPTASGSYYLHLQARNGDGVANQATLTLGPYIYQTVAAVSKISEAWAFGDGEALTLNSKAVVAVFPSDSFWIEESDRTAAMRVFYPAASSDWLSRLVTVIGSLDSTVRPRSLVASSVQDMGPASPEIEPVGVVLRSLGGGGFNLATLGITGGTGQYNVGMLVRVAGRVAFADNTSDPSDKYFYVDDGSAVSSGGHTGVRVKCGGLDAPTSGAVRVTGVISVEQSGGGYVPVLLTRGQQDVVVL